MSSGDMAQKKKFPARIIKEIKPCLLKDSNLTPWETPMATCVVYGNYMTPPPPEKRIPTHITPVEIYIKNLCSVPDSGQSLSRAERP